MQKLNAGYFLGAFEKLNSRLTKTTECVQHPKVLYREVIIIFTYLLVNDAQCNENVSSFFAIYYMYYFNYLRCILDGTAETVSVHCQFSNFC